LAIMRGFVKPLAAILALAALLLPAAGPAQPPSAGAATADAVAHGNRQFALRLFREVARTEDGNIFISPPSVVFALGPLVMGAQGETRAAIGRALSYPTTGESLHPAIAALQRGLERSGDRATISIANALWLGRAFAPRPAFIHAAQAHYESAVENVDFGSDPEGAATRINHWADTETHGRIREIVDARSFTLETRLVVTNAVYFLADWMNPFGAGTEPGPFTQIDGRRTDVPLMRQLGWFRHYRGRGFAALDLPYRDERLTMTVLLPDAADGLPALERSLTPALLDRALTALDRGQPAEVDLALPRLNLSKNVALTEPLSRMGMALAFSPNADFRALSDEPVRISSVRQFTFLRVDEEGTEAAAVTVADVVISGIHYPHRPIVFHADHPFLLMIRDRESGMILFFGRIVQPE
jgi:serpin B